MSHFSSIPLDCKKSISFHQADRIGEKNKIKREKNLSQIINVLSEKMHIPVGQVIYLQDIGTAAIQPSISSDVGLHPFFLVRKVDVLTNKELEKGFRDYVALIRKFFNKGDLDPIDIAKQDKALCVKFIQWFNRSGLFEEAISETDEEALAVASDVIYMLSKDDGGDGMRKTVVAHELAHFYIENQLGEKDPLNAKPFLERMGLKVLQRSRFEPLWNYIYLDPELFSLVALSTKKRQTSLEL